MTVLASSEAAAGNDGGTATTQDLPPRRARLGPDEPLHLLALVLDTSTLMRQTRFAAEGRAEAGYAVHAAFRRFLGAEHEPLTWHVEPSRERQTLVWAYSRHPLNTLERLTGQRLMDLVSNGEAAATALMPFRFKLSEEVEVDLPPAKTRLAVAVRCTPLRLSTRGGDAAGERGDERMLEHDAFATERRELLARFEAEGTPRLDRIVLTHVARSRCYRKWLEERLKGCRIETFGLDRFDMARVLRGPAGGRKHVLLPVADMHATVQVEDAGLFRDGLVMGVGRHKAYGMGMLRFRAS